MSDDQAQQQAEQQAEQQRQMQALLAQVARNEADFTLLSQRVTKAETMFTSTVDALRANIAALTQHPNSPSTVQEATARLTSLADQIETFSAQQSALVPDVPAPAPAPPQETPPPPEAPPAPAPAPQGEQMGVPGFNALPPGFPTFTTPESPAPAPAPPVNPEDTAGQDQTGATVEDDASAGRPHGLFKPTPDVPPVIPPHVPTDEPANVGTVGGEANLSGETNPNGTQVGGFSPEFDPNATILPPPSSQQANPAPAPDAEVIPPADTTPEE